ncbi:hypothetical protein VTN00DRAFT_7936 [Thermoascus crustaceus]|uniref:uncharacterized protein n=1 Tax=Thermoascus crustaceus TaxID=5088 RepID=UPI0037428115
MSTARQGDRDPQHEKTRALIETMTGFVTEVMSGHDPSHNPAHVYRVVSLAHTILEAERALHPHEMWDYDETVVTLGALLHDIGDKKYLPAAEATAAAEAAQTDPKRMVYHALVEKGGADRALAEKVQTIVSNVSYSNEVKNPERIRRLIFEDGYRELAIVQDADRLDALGAVGIGRCFTFLGAHGLKHVPDGGTWEMDGAIEHFTDKLEKLEGMMKTDAGREMARVRTQRLREFKSWWEEETSLASAGVRALQR